MIDPDKGLFVGLQGHGFMMRQHLAQLYVAKALGRPTPDYLKRLALEGDGLTENSFR